MPNWASNNLTISGPKSDLENFKIKAEAKEKLGEYGVGEREEVNPLNFNALVPMPNELVGTRAPGDSPNWYEWCHDNWGVKWTPDVNVVEWRKDSDGKDILFYSFQTAWSAPDKFLKNVTLMFPTLTFHLRSCDPAMNWDFEMSICGDDCVERETDFNDEAKEYWGYEEYEDEEEQMEEGGPYAPDGRLVE